MTTASNAVDTILLADLYAATLLRQACLNFICLHSAEVQTISGWKGLKANMETYGDLLVEILEYCTNRDGH